LLSAQKAEEAKETEKAKRAIRLANVAKEVNVNKSKAELRKLWLEQEVDETQLAGIEVHLPRCKCRACRKPKAAPHEKEFGRRGLIC